MALAQADPAASRAAFRGTFISLYLTWNLATLAGALAGNALPGAPFALALSARSNALAEFEGGPGQVALHGIANIGGVPGTAVSHGCVRLTTPDITWLAVRISSGVPVTITN